VKLIYVVSVVSLICFCGGLWQFANNQLSKEKDNVGAFLSMFIILIGFVLLAESQPIAAKLQDLAIVFAKSLED